MAYVITAVGAGGKTTYLRQRAKEYLRQGKKVAVTTTTHIWPPHPVSGRSELTGIPSTFTDERIDDKSNKIDASDMQGDLTGIPSMFTDGRIDDRSNVIDADGMTSSHRVNKDDAVLSPDYVGVPETSGKLRAPDAKEYERICREYDVVLVEGDGSHCMPVKIPSEHEPVIPDNTDEIAVIMGEHAIGRRIDAVCHRYGGDSREKVTARMLEEIAKQHYLIPLRRQYPNARVFYVPSRMPRPKDRILGVVMASGFGRRYGGNKLLDLYRGKPLYRHVLDRVTRAVGKENTVVVTQYETIANQVQNQGIEVLMNDQAQEGIAASIRLGTRKALEMQMDAVVFFAADMPCLPSEEIRFYVNQFLASRKPYGCMVFGKDYTCTNPGAFRLETGAEQLLALKGDRGAMRIMKQEPWNIYYYQIPPEYAQDIDIKAE